MTRKGSFSFISFRYNVHISILEAYDLINAHSLHSSNSIWPLEAILLLLLYVVNR